MPFLTISESVLRPKLITYNPFYKDNPLFFCLLATNAKVLRFFVYFASHVFGHSTCLDEEIRL